MPGVIGLLGEVWYEAVGRVAHAGYEDVDGLVASQLDTPLRG